ncbi:MAG: hypothetical protein V4673_15275 [Pseudomonadota bacterium]
MSMRVFATRRWTECALPSSSSDGIVVSKRMERVQMQVRSTIFPIVLMAMLVCDLAYAAGREPWSEIKVGGLADENRGQYDVMLVTINGSMDFPDRSLYEFPPGAYKFGLGSKKRGNSGEMTMHPLAVELRPCTRYMLVADHSDPQPNRSWRATIRAEEPIESCMKKFGGQLPIRDEATTAGP